MRLFYRLILYFAAMNPLLNELARHITGKSDLQSCSQQELEQLVSKYPAFSSAHLLLAAKSGQDSVINKAQLFFPTGLWNQVVLAHPADEAIFTGGAPAVENPADTAVPVSAELETPFTEEEVVVQTEEEMLADEEEEELSPGTTGEMIDIRIPTDLPSVAELTAPKSEEKPAGSLPDTLTFEPYHTVDYFASQGIRFKDEQKDKDKFSIQLRSFTDWLKTMKRIPASEIVPSTSVSEEKRVEQMAEVSISPREVVTETMAEVWEKQGNRDKAIHIYKKLSLLDPGKSAYFAAKIEQLKHS